MTKWLHEDLDAQLDAYARRAKGCRKAGPSTAEVLGCTAAAGGFAFAGGDAVGAVQHVTSAVSFASQSLAHGFYPEWDIDGGGDDFRFRLFAFPGLENSVAASSGFGGDNAVGDGIFALALAPGFVVGPTLTQGAFANDLLLLEASTQGNFASTTGYLGFRFDQDFDGHGGFKYGWAKARAENDGALNQGVRLILFEWAWDDSGAPIAVGATPAPPTALLTLLGLGALGVAAYRRRREAGLESGAHHAGAGGR
jgi:MYXO-CTERM domain-containing protein